MKTTEVTDRGMLLPPEVEDATRREFLIGAAGLLLLPAACGGGGENSGETAGETRTVEHALGTTRVPVSPQRVVVVDAEATLSNLLALGVEPVAAASYGYTEREFPNVPPRFDEEVRDLEALDISTEEVSLERVATFEPDLIIGYEPNVSGAYEELSRIAPTVATPTPDTDFRTHLRFVAAVFGMEERAEGLISDFERRVDEASENLGDLGTVAIAAIFPGDVRVYGPNSTSGKLLTGLGATVPPLPDSLFGGETIAGHIYGASEEIIPRLDGETLLLLKNLTSREETEYLAELRAKPIWRNLPAVRNGRVLTVDVQLAEGFAGLPGLEATLGGLIRFFSDDGNDG
jgi:iron complex transport system substrate-binding protein